MSGPRHWPIGQSVGFLTKSYSRGGGDLGLQTAGTLYLQNFSPTPMHSVVLCELSVELNEPSR